MEERSTTAPQQLDAKIHFEEPRSSQLTCTLLQITMMIEDPPEIEPEGFILLPNAHKDMVETTAFNNSGDRFASGSVDGKIQIYNRHKNNTWHLCDTWGAHSSEVLQVESPTLPK